MRSAVVTVAVLAILSMGLSLVLADSHESKRERRIRCYRSFCFTKRNTRRHVCRMQCYTGRRPSPSNPFASVRPRFQRELRGMGRRKLRKSTGTS